MGAELSPARSELVGECFIQFALIALVSHFHGSPESLGKRAVDSPLHLIEMAPGDRVAILDGREEGLGRKRLGSGSGDDHGLFPC
jgi:hypothetical protein